MKLVITVIGKDHVGIIASVANILAENNVNIISINQNIMDGYFNMVLIAEALTNTTSLANLREILNHKGQEINVDIKVQHEDIFNAMHKI